MSPPPTLPVAQAGFSGLLQVDGYAGYNRLIGPIRFDPDIQLAYCWAHARRKLVEITRDATAPIAEESYPYGIISPCRFKMVITPSPGIRKDCSVISYFSAAQLSNQASPPIFRGKPSSRELGL